MEQPICMKCGLVMTPQNARRHPELFLHDGCLPVYDTKKCEHEFLEASVNVSCLHEGEGGPVHRWQADVRIVCRMCQLPFRFIGLPAGVDLDGAAVSIDGQEARLAVAPKGHVLTPLESTECGGFTARKVQ